MLTDNGRQLSARFPWFMPVTTAEETNNESLSSADQWSVERCKSHSSRSSGTSRLKRSKVLGQVHPIAPRLQTMSRQIMQQDLLYT